LAFAGAGMTRIEATAPMDLTREANGQLSLVVAYRVVTKPAGAVTLAMTGGKTASVPVNGLLDADAGEWGIFSVPLSCFAQGGVDMTRVTVPFALSSSAALGIDLSSIRIASAPPGPVRCGAK
jgi:beta-glucosidase